MTTPNPPAQSRTKHLLVVNVLIAAIVKTHTQHAQASTWLAGKAIVVCPLSELGFIRISTNPQVMGFTMADARRLLDNFLTINNAERIPADLPVLDSHPRTHTQVTDQYLAELAAKHGCKLATLDGNLSHPAAEVVR